MALVLRDKSICKICGDVIKVKDDVFSFPAFIVNENDPLYIFNDAVFHNRCVNKNILFEKAKKLIAERDMKVGPGKRICKVCGKEILDHNNYLLVEYLSYQNIFNFTHLHKSCVREWNDRTILIKLIDEKVKSSEWKGTYFEILLKYLRDAN